jgi:hypothetical protein
MSQSVQSGCISTLFTLQRVALILNRVRPWMHKKAYSGTKEERESSHNQVVGL